MLPGNNLRENISQGIKVNIYKEDSETINDKTY